MGSTYVSIVFWDHVQDGPPKKFEVIGKLVGEDDLHYKVGNWLYFEEEFNGEDSNESYFSVLKSTVVRTEVLKR